MNQNEILKTLATLPEDQRKEFLRNYYNDNLFDFCKVKLKYKDLSWRAHKDMIRALESNTKRKLIVMPRGTFKSSVACVGYPIWHLNKDPNKRILLDSEIYTNSKNFLREIKDGHLMRPDLVDLYGSYKSSQWNEGEITIAQRTKVFKEASITCGGVETVKVGQHYDIIIHDDLNSDKNSKTKEGRQKVIDHYKMNISILEPDGVMVVIGTRYAADDIIGHILKNEVGLLNDEILKLE